MNITQQGLRRNCIHEAGHAVIARRNSLNVRLVRVWQRNWISEKDAAHVRFVSLDWTSIGSLHATMAGPLAEAKYLREKPDWFNGSLPTSDETHVRKTMLEIAGGRDPWVRADLLLIRRYRAQYERDCRKSIDKLWAAIVAVADVLEREGVIYGNARLDAIISAALPPLKPMKSTRRKARR